MSTISTTITNGITLGTTGTYTSPLTITSTGAVEASSGDAIFGPNPQAWTVENQGTVIASSGVGVSLHAGGAVRNLSMAALIYGASDGVTIAGVAGRVVNSGTIAGIGLLVGIGVNLKNGGYVGNTGGLILGDFAGVYLGQGTGTVTNSGIITGTAGPGIGVYGAGSGGHTLVNAGTITGSSGTAVFFGAGGNLVIVDPGAVFSGIVNSGIGNSNVLELASAASVGMMSGLGTQYRGFNHVTVDAGARWTLSGNNTISSGVTLNDLGTLTNTGTLAGHGSLIVGPISPASFLNSGYIELMVTLSGGGYLTNASTGTISYSAGGIYSTGVAATVVNDGTISASYGYALHLFQGGTVIDSGSIRGGNGTAISFGGIGSNLLVLENGYKLVGGVRGSGYTGAINRLELSDAAGAVAVNYNGLGLTNFSDLLFGTGGNATLLVSNTTGTLGGTISGFAAASDVIDLTAIGTDGTITNNDTVNHRVTISGSSGTVTLRLDATDATGFQTAPDGATGTALSICFCRGTLILTDQGEVPVEKLATGDRVRTLSGSFKPIVWIGFGHDLVTRKNPLARPIIVRQGALADNMPRRDLYLTHGHALYFDGVLIPVENLVNHRSIQWDDEAKVVEYYHIELPDHEVVFAEGAPAETYYDVGNRALFQNARPGSEPGVAMPTFAPVLHEGELVGKVWAALDERAGGRREGDTTDDPDLHLVVYGQRLGPISHEGGVYTFALDAPPAGTLLLSSRSAVPSLLGFSRHEHRRLGVAIRQIILYQPGVMSVFDHDAPLFGEGGCHAPESTHTWTDGEFALPERFFAHLKGAFTLVVHTRQHSVRYPISDGLSRAA